MRRQKKRTQREWLVVATAHTDRGLRQAAAMRPGRGIDLVEIRLDCLRQYEESLPRIVAGMKIPLILTARHPLEGGAGKLSAARRGQLLAATMPWAAFVDIELRSADQLRDALALAKRRRVATILSFHDFKRTPPAATLRKKVREGRRLGAAVVKIATTLRNARDLAALVELQESSEKLATMGMGSLGKVSRLVLPLAGATFVYGYLDRPQVEGQWPAELLAARLGEVAP